MKAIKLMLLILILSTGKTVFSQSCSCGDWELFTVNNKNYKCGAQIDAKCNVPVNYSARYNCKPNNPGCVARIETDVKKDGVVIMNGGSGPHNYLYGNFIPKSNGVYVITLYPTCNGNKCTPCTLTITVKDCPGNNSGTDVCNCGDKSTDISTGFENTSKTLIPNGQPDNEWRIIANPTSPTPNYSTGVNPIVANPGHPAWALATSRAKWLRPPSNIDAKVGEYQYQYIFTVPPGYTGKVKISRIGGDDDVELFVDYTKVYSKTGGWAFSEKFVQQQKCIEIGGLSAGSHTITIKVKNTDQGATGAYLEGCYELIPCHCPKGWLSNTNVQDGGVTTDGKCKKLVCSPIGVIPPPNGTSVGNWGFTWGNELWAWGTKENGGAVICDDKAVNNYEGETVIAIIKNNKAELAGGKEPMINVLQEMFNKENQKIKVRDIKLIRSTFDYFLSVVTTAETKKEITFFVKLATADGVQYRPIGGNSQTPTCVNEINCTPDASNNYKGCSIFQYGPQGYQTGCNCGGDATFAETPANGNTAQKGCYFDNGYIRAYDFAKLIDMALLAAKWHLE